MAIPSTTGKSVDAMMNESIARQEEITKKQIAFSMVEAEKTAQQNRASMALQTLKNSTQVGR